MSHHNASPQICYSVLIQESPSPSKAPRHANEVSSNASTSLEPREQQLSHTTTRSAERYCPDEHNLCQGLGSSANEMVC